MNSFLLYLLESSVFLMVFYGLYLLLLRKETFFSFNRFFLMAILALSFLFPLVSIDISGTEKGLISKQISDFGKARSAYYTTFESWSSQQLREGLSEKSWWQKLQSQEWTTSKIIMASVIVIYVVGVLFLMIRLISIYVKIYRLKRSLSPKDLNGLKVAEIPSQIAPFSFLNTVFIPNNIEDKSEYEQILAHEKTHIQQKHSIDLIIVQLLAAFLWFNPVVWLLIKSLKQTHEYIADKNMLLQGFSLVEYQSLLLRQLISNNSYALVHNFNLSFIKKRITMMSIKESGWTGRSKALAALSIILLMGIMTAQSNTMLDVPSQENENDLSGDKTEMKFYVDGISLSDGLNYSKIRNSRGAFSFEVQNEKKDNIYLKLQLFRVGQNIDDITAELQEGSTIKIDDLLQKAKLDDYVVIDIIDGPSEVAKLYNFPLFRESESWEKNQVSDLPPPPVELFVDGIAVNEKGGISFSRLKKQDFDAELEYVLSEFVDFEVLSRQAGDVTTTLVRKGEVLKSITSSGVKPKASIPLKTLLEVAKKGDSIMVQFGDPSGLQFGSMFTLQ